MSTFPAQFISIEGVEGAGKSTNIAYMTRWFEDKGITFKRTREPGGTTVGEAIRSILLADTDEPLLSTTEALLFYAARYQHVEHSIRPSLEQGVTVLCDRFFDATLAYQGCGREMGLERIQALNEWTLGDFKPDYTLLFDLPVEQGLERIKQRQSLDRIEKEKVAFFERIRQCYLDFAKKDPKRYRVIDASLSLEAVQSQLEQVLNEIFLND